MAILVVMPVQGLMPVPVPLPMSVCMAVTVLLVMPNLLSVVVTPAGLGRECHAERAGADQYCAKQGCD